jgi:hypothetical protein
MSTVNILGSFLDTGSLDQGSAKLVNVRVVPRDPKEGREAGVRFMGAPGLDVVSRPANASCLALSHALGTVWSVHADGSVFYDVQTGAPHLAGFVTLNPTLPIVRLAEDRTALVIATNANTINPALAGTGYTATQGGGVVNAGFDASINFDPSAVAILENFTVWGGASNFYANQDSKMFSSLALQPANVPGANFSTKEARADKLVDLAVSQRVLWPLGARSCEQWYNPGAATNFAFSSYPNSLLSVGIAARGSLAVIRDAIMFVGTDRRVWGCSGQAGQAISPPWLDLMLQRLTTAALATLTAYAYGQGGSDFYVLTLPGQWTVELCSATSVWSYRQSPGGRLDHASRCATEHDGGVTYVGLDTGHVCTVDLNSATEPAGTLNRLIQTMWVGSQESRQTFDSIDIASTMGAAAGALQFDWSETFPVPTWRGVRQITLPNTGQVRAIAREMGTGRRRVLRLQYSGTQAPFTIDEMFARISPGN